MQRCIPWPLFPWRTSVASSYVVNRKPAPQMEASGPGNRPFHRKTEDVFQPGVGAVPWYMPKVIYIQKEIRIKINYGTPNG